MLSYHGTKEVLEIILEVLYLWFVDPSPLVNKSLWVGEYVPFSKKNILNFHQILTGVCDLKKKVKN